MSSCSGHEPPTTNGANGTIWRDDVIYLIIDKSVTDKFPDASYAIEEAAKGWNEQFVAPEIQVLLGEDLDLIVSFGYNPDGLNQNIIIYNPDGKGMKNALATTIITFNTETKTILDADISINGKHNFCVNKDKGVKVGCFMTYDLQNVMAHEIGHVFGLSETYDDESATMYAYSSPSETKKRSIERCDINALMEIY